MNNWMVPIPQGGSRPSTSSTERRKKLPQAKSAVANSTSHGTRRANTLAGVASRISAPMAPPTRLMRVSVRIVRPGGLFASARPVKPVTSWAGNSATVEVMLAARASMPVSISDGSVMNEPPPASAFCAPAQIAAMKRTTSEIVIGSPRPGVAALHVAASRREGERISGSMIDTPRVLRNACIRERLQAPARRLDLLEHQDNLVAAFGVGLRADAVVIAEIVLFEMADAKGVLLERLLEFADEALRGVEALVVAVESGRRAALLLVELLRRHDADDVAADLDDAPPLADRLPVGGDMLEAIVGEQGVGRLPLERQREEVLT